MNFKLQFWVFAAVLVSTPVTTIRAQDARQLTLRQAQDLAITNHPRITEAELIALASKQVVREARSAFFPSIYADATAVDSTANNTRIAAGGLNNPLILSREAGKVNLQPSSSPILAARPISRRVQNCRLAPRSKIPWPPAPKFYWRSTALILARCRHNPFWPWRNKQWRRAS